MRKKEPINRQQGFEYALRLLNQRHYSEFKLRQKLSQRGAQDNDIGAIMEKLRELRLVDDARYAHAVLRNELTFRHTSRRVASLKLRQKGIDTVTIAQTIADCEATPSELERATYQAQRYKRKLSGLPIFEQKQKLAAFLYRKGFEAAVIRQVTGELDQPEFRDET